MKHVVIYHHPCSDGIAAAWVVNEYLKARHVTEIVNLPMNHGDPFDPNVCEGAIVWMVDFSLPLPTMDIIARTAEHLHWYDHHITAKPIMEEISIRYKRTDTSFSKEVSGALLTWNLLNPGVGAPSFILYVSDRDTWKHRYPESARFYDAMRLVPLTLDAWTEQIEHSETTRRVINGVPEPKGYNFYRYMLHSGEVDETIRQYRSVEMDAMIALTIRTLPMHYQNEAGVEQTIIIPTIQVPVSFASEALDSLKIDALPVASYQDTQTHRLFSLRSKTFDCTLIACYYGGGGHRNAAGFRVERTHPLAKA